MAATAPGLGVQGSDVGLDVVRGVLHHRDWNRRTANPGHRPEGLE